MSLLNDRDMLLQATFPRQIDQGNGKLLLLTASAPLFHVSTDGSGAPEAITLTASPINLPGNAAFSIVGGTLTGSGNVRALAYADMTAPSAMITATITYQGVDYSSVQIINKVLDGVNGPRGSQTLFVAGSTWSDAAADSATTGPNQVGDTVTISNGGTFALVKTWNGTAWVPPGVVIDGGLIVTNSITAAQINGNNLAIRDASGNVILSASSALGGTYIANAAITAAKIADAQITAAKIADAQITAAKIADATITAAKIADATITAAKIAAATITTAKIADAQITTAKIVTAAVDTLQLAGQAVTIPLSARSSSLASGGALSLTIASTGAPILLLGSSYGGCDWESVSLYRNGTLLVKAESWGRPFGGGYMLSSCITYVDQPGAGTFTYQLVRGGSSTGDSGGVFVSGLASFALLETKR